MLRLRNAHRHYRTVILPLKHPNSPPHKCTPFKRHHVPNPRQLSNPIPPIHNLRLPSPHSLPLPRKVDIMHAPSTHDALPRLRVRRRIHAAPDSHRSMAVQPREAMTRLRQCANTALGDARCEAPVPVGLVALVWRNNYVGYACA
jgi:hypothetical protein